MSGSPRGKLRDATAGNPCAVCAGSNWCSASEDGGVLICRRMEHCTEYGTGVKKTDRNGATFYQFFTRPRALKGEPPKHSHTEGATKTAAPAERDRVYRAFLELLPRAGVGDELDRRGVPGDSPLRKWYRSLPLAGRAGIARQMVAGGLEPLMARTPGFFVKVGDGGAGYWTFGGRPGLVIPVTDAAGRVVALALRPVPQGDGGKYVWFTSGKKGGAKCRPVPHAPKWDGPTDVARLTEGVLKADVATEQGGVLTVGLPGLHSRKVAATLSALKVKTVRLAFDRDAATNANVARAVALHFRRLTRAGFAVELERWGEADGKGIDDVLAAGKTPELVTGPAVAEAVAELEKASRPKSGGGSRRAVTIDTHQAEVCRQVVEALAASDPDLYQRAGALVAVVPAVGPKPGPPGVVTLTAASIQNRVTDCVFLCEVKGEGTENERVAPAHPPTWLAAAIRDAGAWPGVRPLAGVTTAPVLRPDGTVHQAPGYDPATALFYAPTAPFEPAPENPTRADAAAALRLLKSGVAEFPWQEPSDLSAWLAEVITIAVRAAFDGPAPGFYHVANTAASGKTTLARAAGFIGTGIELPAAPYPVAGRRGDREEDVEEVRKLANACAIAAHPAFLLDNVPSGTVFGSGVMDAILTSTVDAGRQLGTASAPRREMKTVWIWSGNNILPTGDTGRRALRVGLLSTEERPEEREFSGLDVEEWARRHRPELFIAALTVAAAYIRTGRPAVGLKPMGSFQAWSDLVRSALVWAGEPDPCANRGAAAAEDPERGNALCLIRLLVACGAHTSPMTAQEIADAVKAEMAGCRPIGTNETSWVLAAVPSDRPRSELYRAAFPTARFPEASRLGYALRKHKARVIDAMRIVQPGLNRDKIALWTVDEVRGMRFSIPRTITRTVNPFKARDLAATAGDAGDVYLPLRV